MCVHAFCIARPYSVFVCAFACRSRPSYRPPARPHNTQERKRQKLDLLQTNELLSDTYKELVKAGDLKDARFWEPLLGSGKPTDTSESQEVRACLRHMQMCNSCR